MSSRSSVEEPFLHGMGHTLAVRRDSRMKNYLILILATANFIFLVTSIGLYSQVHNIRSDILQVEEVFSPAKHVVRHQNVVFTAGFGHERTEYQGPPTTQRDALWDDLYGFGVSHISRDAAAKLVNKTVPIPGMPGQYVVELSVFHQLHCLNMIRKSLYSTVEYAPDDELMGIEHLEHCYDAIRQTLMCYSDITPLPWKWIEEAQEAKEVAQVVHTCRDFEAVRQWGKENAVVNFDTKTYVADDLRSQK